MQNIYDLQTTVPRYVTLYGPHGQVTLSNKEQALQRFTLTGLDGFYGGAGVHVEDTQRQLGHGSFAAPAWRTGKFMTLRGTFTFANDRDRTVAARWLSALYWDGKLGELTADYDGLELTARVRLDGAPSIVEQGVNILKVEIPLFAPDPFLYAAPRLYQIFPAGAGEGLVFPLFTTKGKATSANLAGFASTATSNGTVTAAEDGQQVLTVTREGNSFPGSFVLTSVPTTPGKNYTIKTRVQGSAPGTSYAMRTNINGGSYASSKYFVTDVAGGIVVPAAVGSWDERTWTVTAPKDSATMSVTWFPIHSSGSQVGTQSLTMEVMESTPVLDWGAGTPTGGAFANSGNADAHPTYTVHGSWPAGFRITTGSKVVEYPAAVVPSHPVVIDHKTGSVSVSGVDQTYRLTRRDWVAVPAGEAIQPHITGLAPSTGWCDITISDTYI